MSFKLLLPLLLALLAAKIAAQTALTSSTASPRHGDILCRIEIPLVILIWRPFRMVNILQLTVDMSFLIRILQYGRKWL